ncbi:DHHA1 domain-containing protein [Chloroflexota bacterium]
MTDRLYYGDPYQTRFSACVVERLQQDGRPALVLDRTAFYPTGGGQPHDTGRLDDVSVVDVLAREVDGAVLHLLAEPLEAEKVEGQVDWGRRFDLMQQHTGQHILSAAFAGRLGANTVGFHLSEEYATLDLDRAPLTADELIQVESLANAIVFENRRAVTRFVPDEEVPHLPLRKPLAKGHKGAVRVVEIPGFDSSACGGTHVRATGEVGLIKIVRGERRGTETRVEFLCGGRALSDYAAKNAMLLELAQEFTVGHWELAGTVHRLANDLRETRRELRRTRDALLEAEATALWHQAGLVGPFRVVRAHFVGRAMDDLKHLAQRLISHPQTVALLGTEGRDGEKSYFTFARSDDLDLDMGTLVRQACQVIGGRGGGRPNFAQGGGPEGSHVAQALDEAFQSLVG